MPSSYYHCEVCPFNDVEQAQGPTAGFEDTLVSDYLYEAVFPAEENLFSSKETAGKALDFDVEPERLFAARACAKKIKDGECPWHNFDIKDGNYVLTLTRRFE